jgi:hypothetical protein
MKAYTCPIFKTSGFAVAESMDTAKKIYGCDGECILNTRGDVTICEGPDETTCPKCGGAMEEEME